MTRDVITTPAEKNLARRIHRDDLLHNELRRFETTKFVYVETIGQLNNAAKRTLNATSDGRKIMPIILGNISANISNGYATKQN